MKLSLTRWIDTYAAALVMLAASAFPAAAQGRPERPDVIAGFYRASPAEPRVIAYMPDAVPPLVLSPLPRVYPTDITVLSSSPRDPVIKILPEPIVSPAPARPAAAAAKPAPAATPVPAAAAAATKPVAAATSAPAATAPAATAPASVPTPVAPATAASAAIVKPAATVVPDAKLEAWRGERFEIRLPGTGWTYLGDENGKDGVRFETRRFEDGEAAFALNPEKAGQYLLRFQRQDPVELSTVTKLVALTVSDREAVPKDSASSIAPAATPTPTAPTATVPAATTPAATTPAATTPDAAALSLAAMTDPDAILAYARDELGASRIRPAMDALDRYVSIFPYGNDELFYLYGLAYEQDTPFRNIKKAYEYYKRVRDEYPRSKRWREAADRIAYLERHYFGLR